MMCSTCINIKDFIEKYPKPRKCPMPDDVWTDGISYCWGYAQTIDSGEAWNDNQCPCEFFESINSTEQQEERKE